MKSSLDCIARLKRKIKMSLVWLNFFFFQAEDGIRDVAVTGVQTCALPISGLAPCGCRPRQSACKGRTRGISRPRSEEHTSNSSHGYISYAVFCLKKKNKRNAAPRPAPPQPHSLHPGPSPARHAPTTPDAYS